MGPLPLVIFLLVGQTDSPPASTPNPPPSASAPNPNDTLPPLTGIARLDWAVKGTIGPASLWTGVFSAGWGTAFNHPKEYGQNFDGFAKRYGLRLTGVATSNVMEASLGAIWHEDPRYHRAYQQPFRSRLSHALKTTFLAEEDGRLAPAYARYIAIAGGNALSDTWRPDSERTAGNTFARIGYGFGGRLAGNLWEEFWPDMKKHMFWNRP